MQILKVAGDDLDYRRDLGGTYTTEGSIGSAGPRKRADSRYCLNCSTNGTLGVAFGVQFPARTSFGATWRYAADAINSNVKAVAILSGTTTLFYFDAATSSGTPQLRIRNAAGTVLATSALGWAVGTYGTRKWSLEFNLHATTGYLRLYIDDGLVVQYEGDTTAGVSDVDTLAWGHAGQNHGISEVVIVDSDPRLITGLQTLIPESDGTNQWTGGYAQVDDGYSDFTDTATSDAAGEVLKLNLPAVTPGSDGTIAAVVVSACAAVGAGSAVTKLSVGIDSDVPTATQLGSAPQVVQKIYALNPNGSVNWTEAAVNAAQINLVSAT